MKLCLVIHNKLTPKLYAWESILVYCARDRYNEIRQHKFYCGGLVSFDLFNGTSDDVYLLFIYIKIIIILSSVCVFICFRNVVTCEFMFSNLL